MANQDKPDNFARVFAALSLLVAGVGLYITRQTSQEDHRAISKVAAQEALKLQAEDFLRQVEPRYVYVDDSSVSKYIAAVLPLYRDPLNHYYKLKPENLDHVGLTASFQEYLKRFQSFQKVFSQVSVEATDAKHYQITAVETTDRTYFDGRQPLDCRGQGKTRTIQDVKLLLEVETDPTGKKWLVVSEDDVPLTTKPECHSP